MSFSAGHIFSDRIWLSLLAKVVASGRRFMSDSVYRGLVDVPGGSLVFLGVQFDIFAWSRLR